MQYIPESTNWNGQKKVLNGVYAGKMWSEVPIDKLKSYQKTAYGYFRDMVCYELDRRNHENP